VTVALALAAVLMTAALGVLMDLSRSEAAVTGAARTGQLEDRLHRLFAHDLAHATTCRRMPDGFALHTASAFEGTDMARRHLTCKIVYEVRRIADRNWLVRSQEGPDGVRLDELVCADVRSVELGPAGSVAEKWKPVPDEVVITVIPEGEGAEGMEFAHRKGWAP